MPLGPLPLQNPSTVNDYPSFILLFFIFNKKILAIKKPDRNIFNAINFIVKLDQVLIFNYHSFVNLCKKESKLALYFFCPSIESMQVARFLLFNDLLPETFDCRNTLIYLKTAELGLLYYPL